MPPQGVGREGEGRAGAPGWHGSCSSPLSRSAPYRPAPPSRTLIPPFPPSGPGRYRLNHVTGGERSGRALHLSDISARFIAR